jgi:hypothetical protein
LIVLWIESAALVQVICSSIPIVATLSPKRNIVSNLQCVSQSGHSRKSPESELRACCSVIAPAYNMDWAASPLLLKERTAHPRTGPLDQNSWFEVTIGTRD